MYDVRKNRKNLIQEFLTKYKPSNQPKMSKKICNSKWCLFNIHLTENCPWFGQIKNEIKTKKNSKKKLKYNRPKEIFDISKHFKVTEQYDNLTKKTESTESPKNIMHDIMKDEELDSNKGEDRSVGIPTPTPIS